MRLFSRYMKIIYLDFSLFNDNLFIFSHSVTVPGSYFIQDSTLLFLCCVLSVNWFNVLESVVSSAYIMKLNILLTCGKSLI